MTDAYQEDLAYIHDAGFGGFAKNAAPVLLDALLRGGLLHGRVIDLGCGSGILAHELTAAGYDVLGIDISAAMIALARKRVPEARFRRESLLTAELPRCVAVTAVGEGLNYLFDRRNSDQALARLFRRIAEALCPGGVFLLDVAGPGRVRGAGPQRNFMEGDDWAVLVTVEEDRRRRILTRQITSFRRVGECFRRDRETHQQRLLRRSEIAAQLRGVEFRVRTLAGYGPLPFAPGQVGFLARKP